MDYVSMDSVGNGYQKYSGNRNVSHLEILGHFLFYGSEWVW